MMNRPNRQARRDRQPQTVVCRLVPALLVCSVVLPRVAQAQSWYDADWGYRKTITIASSKVSTVSGTNLTNFPMLISATDVQWKDTGSGGNVAQSDGGDIVFTASDGTTKLDHHIGRYSPSSGALTVWVEIPSLAAATDTIIYMYYGNAGVADQWSQTGTWSNSFHGAWHLEDASGDVLEFDTTQGKFPSMVHVSGDVYALAYQGDGDDGWLVTVDINAAGAIENAAIDALEFDTAQGKAPRIIQVSGDIYAIAYQGDGDDGWLKTVDISTDGTINGIVGSLEFDTDTGKVPAITHVSGDIFAIVYQGGGDDGWLVTVDINSDGSIAGAVGSLEFDTTQGKEPEIVPVSGDIYAIVHQGPGDDGWLVTVDINTDGSITGAVGSLEFDTTQGKFPEIHAVAGDIYAVSYSGVDDDGWLKTVDINTNGSIAGVVSSLEYDTAQAKSSSILPVSGDVYAISYRGPDDDGWLVTIDITAGGTINGVLERMEYDLASGKEPVMLPVAGDVFAIAYEADLAHGAVTTIDITSDGDIGEFPDGGPENNDARGLGGSSTTGRVVNGLNLDGTDDWLRVPPDASLDIASNLTLSGWFKLDTTFNSASATSLLIAEKYGDADHNMHIALVGTDYTKSEPSDGSLVFKIEDGAGGMAYRYVWTTQTSWTAGQWYHFVATTDSSNAANNKVYINGANATNSSVGGGGSNALDLNYSAELRFGGRDADTDVAGARFFDGMLDELRLADAPRSADWVVTEYNNQSAPGTFYAVSVESAGLSVGPAAAGACKGSNCDYNTIQSAINVAGDGDIITLYLNDDTQYAPAHTDNNCYNEHITINVPNLTLQGDSTTPVSATCIGPSTGGDIVTITASGVTLRNLEISGKRNDGTGGENAKGAGGRSSGYGVYISGDDVDDVVLDNVTISFTRLDNIRWDGDQNDSDDGNVTIRNCYLHHSDLPGYNIRIIGGSASGAAHLVENNLITTGQGVFSDAAYVTARMNIIGGWPYWGHIASDAVWPETHDYNAQSANFGGGWRYFSRAPAGIYIQNGGAGTEIEITHNIVFGTRVGIRVQTSGTLANNTVVNPYNTGGTTADAMTAATVRDGTVGILLVSGFSGTVENNIVVVTEDNRATGQPGQLATPRYTTGITGYGIAFSGGSGTLGGGAAVNNNNVWGFVDTDGSTPTPWGSGLESCGENVAAQCSSNVSRDPLFAADTSDESNGGVGPCDADAADTRCYELYPDNYFLKSNRANGSCHADILANTAGYVGFVDLSGEPELAGLGACVVAADSGAPSSLIDLGNGTVSDEPGNDGGFPNLGAFGNTGRASQAPSLRLVGIDVGEGGVRNNSTSYSSPGIVQARDGGITEVNLYFNRAPSLNGLSSFEFRNLCDSAALGTAPTLDTSAASLPPFKVTLSWPAGTYERQGIRIHVLADHVANKVVDYQGEALDGEISDISNGTLPSGNGTAGGDAEFAVYALLGDVDGDRDVDAADRAAVAARDGSTTAGLPADIDGDGTVEGGAGEDDYLAVDAVMAEHWVNSTADTLSATTLRQALTDVADGETITFDVGTFDACQQAVIDVDGSALPTLDDDNVTIDATTLGVTLRDTDNDLANGADGLTISGDGNSVYGLTISNFDAGASSDGITITGASNTIGGTAAGQANTITANGAAGIYAGGATADGNSWLRNLIHGNSGGSVELAGDGANDDRTPPVISRAVPVQVRGTAVANATIEVFGNNDGNSNCEVYLGSTTADGSGDWTLGGLSLTTGEYAVAIQTDGDGDSSETSTPRKVAYYINTLADENDGSCTNGDCSLRDALTLLGNNDEVYFDPTVFPPATPATIDVDSSPLPTLNDSGVLIDASDSGVILRDTDSDLGGSESGLVISGSSNIVRGLQVLDFDDDNNSIGIYITGASNTIGGTYNGAAANGLGQGCVVSSNGRGIMISGAPATGNIVKGCLIGTTLSGTAAYGNVNEGILIESNAHNNVIGGPAAGEGNLISGNSKQGIKVDTANGTAMYGNYIGTDITGATALANLEEGILLDKTDSTVVGGDRDDGYGNLISASLKDGIKLKDGASDSNVFKGNYIGTDITGTADLGNGRTGLRIENSRSSIIGSTTAGEENLMAYNADRGIHGKGASADFNTWRANILHSNAASNIRIEGGANENLIGPLVNSASTTQVVGSGAQAGATVDVFSNPDADSDCAIYLGAAIADGGGNWSLSGLSLTIGHGVVAVQTLVNGNSSQLGAPGVVESMVVDTTSDVVDGTTTSKAALEAAPGADGKISLREALLAAADGDAITFSIAVFPPGSPATIDVDGSALPVLDVDNVILSGAGAGVIIEDSDSDLGINDHGLDVTGDNNVVKGLIIQNFSGSNADCVHVSGSSNTIGGGGDGDPNIITGCGDAGIEVTGTNADYNSLRQNLIYSNGDIAIDLNSNGNNNLGSPTIDTVMTTQVDGSGAAAGAKIDLFSNSDGDSDCLAYVDTVEADGSGNWSIIELTLTTGQYIVAVQTDANGDSSEVSAAVIVP